MKPEYGYDYVKQVAQAYPDVPGMADYCVYWFRKRTIALPAWRTCWTRRNAKRSVKTKSRSARLDYIVEMAERSPRRLLAEVWSGEAAVHVSIVNWVRSGASWP